MFATVMVNLRELFLYFVAAVAVMVTGSSCANIVAPGGGPIDSLPPRLLTAVPADSSTNIQSNRITLTFDEFVDVDNPQQNVIVSPLPQNAPTVTRRLRTVTVTLRDTLQPNTTYSIDFGNAIKDINESNIIKNFTYVFSTGSEIHDASISGSVHLAQTGEVDSTLIVALHTNLHDSAVTKLKPRYITRISGNGQFTFRNLAPGRYAVYVLPNDYTKRYDDSTKLFAFLDSSVVASDSAIQVRMYAFRAAEKKSSSPTSIQPPPPTPAKGSLIKPAGPEPLRFTTNATSVVPLLDTVRVMFNRNVRIDTRGLSITDTSFTAIRIDSMLVDSNSARLLFKMQEGSYYNLIIDTTVATDSAGNKLHTGDTLRFVTNREIEYGSVRLKFVNIDPADNPVLLLLQGGNIVEQIDIAQGTWYRRLFKPGEYQLKVLYDRNGNKKWDNGSFLKNKKQPEVVRDLRRNIVIRSNWDNETDLTF